MNGALETSIIAISPKLVVVVAALAIARLVAELLSRRSEAGIKRTFWLTAVIAASAARLTFVLEYLPAYLGAPLTILDVRDGGWNLPGGILAAWIYATLGLKTAPHLRKPLIVSLSAATILVGAGSLGLDLKGRREMQLSAVSVPTFDGEKKPLNAFLGKPTLVNMWATWCAPCQRELPLLRQAQAAHPEINFVFLNQGESRGKVTSFLSVRDLAMRNVLFDEKGKAGADFMGALPTTSLFDARGQFIKSHLGEYSPSTLEHDLIQLTMQSTTP